MKHIQQVKGTNVVDIGIDLKEFYLSVEWDILAVPATRNEEYYGASNNDYRGQPTDDEEETYESDEAEQYHEKLLTGVTVEVKHLRIPIDGPLKNLPFCQISHL